MTFDDIRSKQDGLFGDTQKRIDALFADRPSLTDETPCQGVAWLGSRDHEAYEQQSNARMSAWWRVGISTGRRELHNEGNGNEQ